MEVSGKLFLQHVSYRVCIVHMDAHCTVRILSSKNRRHDDLK